MEREAVQEAVLTLVLSRSDRDFLAQQVRLPALLIPTAASQR